MSFMEEGSRGNSDNNTLEELFLAKDYDPLEYVKRIGLTGGKGNNNSSVEETLMSLQAHKETVDHAISAHISQNNEHLLSTLETVGLLKDQVLQVRDHAKTISSSLKRIKRSIQGPVNELKDNTKKLGNIQKASQLIRKTRWFLTSSQKLKTLWETEKATAISSGRELAKASQIIQDLEVLIESKELKGVKIVEADIGWIKEVGSQLRTSADELLKTAIEDLNQAEIGSCLQAFFHLRCLPERIDLMINWAVSTILAEIREALDIHYIIAQAELQIQDPKKKPKRDAIHAHAATSTKNHGIPAEPNKMKAELWQSALWSRIDAMNEIIRSWCLRIWNVQRVLNKKRDSVTHVPFASIQGVPGAFNSFWRKFTSGFEGEISRATRISSFLRNTLVNGYPRFRRLLRILLRRLNSSTTIKGSSTQSVGSIPEHINELLGSLTPLLSDFLAKSLTRLSEPVQQMFPKSTEASAYAAAAGLGDPPSKTTLPTMTDVATFAGVISHELALATVSLGDHDSSSNNSGVENSWKGHKSLGDEDTELILAVSKSCSKAINLFVSKAEQLVTMTESAYRFQLIPPKKLLSLNTANASAAPVASSSRTNAQQHNMTVLALVVQLWSVLKKSQNAHHLVNGLSRLADLANLILGSYLAGCIPAIESIISGIHKETYIAAPATGHGGYLSDETKSSSSSYSLTTTAEENNSEPDIHMKNLETAISVLLREHLQKIGSDGILVREALCYLYQRIIVIYVRNVSLVRQVDAQGRFRLIRNLSHFEQCLNPISELFLLQASSNHHQQQANSSMLFETEYGTIALEEFKTMKQRAINEIRGLKRLLALNPSRIGDYTNIKQSGVRKSTILHHLYASAPFALRSPHVEAKLSITAYLKRIDEAEIPSAELNGMNLLRCGTFAATSSNNDRNKSIEEEKETKSEREMLSLILQSMRAYESRVKSTLQYSIDDPLTGMCEEYIVMTGILSYD